MKKTASAFIVAVMLYAAPLFGGEVPALRGYVNDYAGMLSPTAEQTLEQELRDFEQTDSTQVVILTVPSLEGKAIEEFSMTVAETWGIGRRGKDNGIILLMAMDERKIRIEVGRGLEGPLTDLLSGRIIDLIIKPRFKQGDFDGGVAAGVAAIIDATRGEFKADGGTSDGGHQGFWELLPFLLFGAVMVFSLLSNVAARSGRRRGGIWHGGGFGGSFGGGGFDSGGFSGGGGDFGGGGASGDW